MFSLVVPVYLNEASLPALLGALEELGESLPEPLEVVLVVDGSPDRSLEWLQEHLPRATFASQLLAHSRNFGAFAAIRTGMRAARGSWIAVMAADLQEPISLAKTFFTELRSGKADVVVGQRIARADPLVSRWASGLFWRSYRALVNPEIPPGGVDVFGCNEKVKQVLLSLGEANSSLVAQLFWVGYRRTLVPYERVPRREGKSAWTFSKKLRYLLDSIYSFTQLPIRLLGLSGALSMGIALGLGGLVLASRLAGKIQVPGYTPTVLTVMFFGGLNALGLSIIGEYVWRAFENTKARPESLVADRFEFAGCRAETKSALPG